MRDRIRLDSERRRHAVLILAEHIWKCGPAACDLFVLDQSEPNGRQKNQKRGCELVVFSKEQDKKHGCAGQQKDELVGAREQLKGETQAQQRSVASASV